MDTKEGFGAPFVRVYYNGGELSAMVTSFKYQYFEEGDDVCVMEIRSINRNEPDQLYWQKGEELQILWGWLSNGFEDSQVSPIRKIYVQESNWKFMDDGIYGTIEATDKAVSLKYEDSQDVYTNTSLPEVVQQVAQKTSLKAFLEWGAAEDEFPPLITDPKKFAGKSIDLEKYLEENRKAVERKKPRNEKFDLIEGYNTQRLQLVPDHRFDSTAAIFKKHIAPEQSPSKVIQVTPEQYLSFMRSNNPNYVDVLGNSPIFGNSPRFLVLPNVVGGNRSYLQVIDELAKQEPNGPWFLDTRDDSVTLKRRNFLQKPYRSYTYGGEDGLLKEYTPMSKQRRYGPAGDSAGFVNWDAARKIIYKGNLLSQASLSPRLMEDIRAYRYYKYLSDKGAGSFLVRPLVPNPPEFNRGGHLDYFQQNPTVDNTSVYKSQVFPFLSVDNYETMMKEALEKAYNATVNNNNFDPMGEGDPTAAYNHAENLRKDRELKNNPSTARVWGDPQIKVGILLTFLGVGKKFSGNHYIVKAVHIIDNSGYFVDLEMVTQGNNLKTPKSTKALGRVNSSIGPSGESTIPIKSIPIKTNPK